MAKVEKEKNGREWNFKGKRLVKVKATKNTTAELEYGNNNGKLQVYIKKVNYKGDNPDGFGKGFMLEPEVALEFMRASVKALKKVVE